MPNNGHILGIQIAYLCYCTWVMLTKGEKMARKKIFEGFIERIEVLDHEGNIDRGEMPKLEDKDLIGLMELMLKMRMSDQKALNLQRQGRIGTYGSVKGQEACQTGLAFNLQKSDWLAPSFREHAIMMAMGIPLHQIYALWKGDERGNLHPEGVNCLPPAIPVASQLIHAAGLGMALKLKEKNEIAVGFGGDGGSSQGDFHEALNFAAVFDARTLFFVQNNGWAISVPFNKQTKAGSIAQKGLAYGVKSLQVDGNDVLAVYKGSKEAVDHVRSGKGPFLLECVTYRMENHTTADDHTRYRSKEEVEFWAKRDPLDRMRLFLTKEGLWNEIKEKEFAQKTSEWIESEVEKLEALAPPDPADIFDHVYSELPWYLKEEKEMILKEGR
jgi:pyruvate dehydrogenase E1 component alpha subunit